MFKHAAWLAALSWCFVGCSGPAAPVDPEIGARLFNGNCVACHQQDARGVPGVYPSLVGSPVLLGDPRDLALWVVRGRRPAALPASRYATLMPQFGWMKPAPAAALFTYLRSHFGNTASTVDPALMVKTLGE